MVATEKTVRLAAQLYEMRDTSKRLLGSRYAEQMADLRKMLETVQSRLKIDNPIAAATKVCTANGLDGIHVAYIMAAACEMIEPSGLTQEAPHE